MLLQIYLFSLVSYANTLSEFPLLLVISFEGFRHDYINSSSTPNIHSLMSNGVHAKWMKSTFVTKTQPNLFSIGTGLYQESHGIVGNEMYDPVFKEIFHPITADSKWWDNGHVLPIWVANEGADSKRYSGGIGWPSTNVSIRGQHAFYTLNVTQNTHNNDLIDTAIKWLSDKTKPANCIFMHFNELGKAGRMFGPQSAKVEKHIKHADETVKYLIQQLKQENLFQKTNIIILGDHGVATVPVKNLIEVDSIVDPSLYKIFGESPVWNILPKDGHEEEIYKKLKDRSKSLGFEIYKKKEIPEEYHYKNNRRVMPLLLVADEGHALVHKNKTYASTIWGGSDGYNNSLLSMGTVFVGHGPAFKQNYSADTFINVDLYPLMCHILQIGTFTTNGSFENVKGMLNKSSSQGFIFSNIKSTVKRFLNSTGFEEGIAIYIAGIVGASLLTVCCMVCICRCWKKKRNSFTPLKLGQLSKNGMYEQHFLIGEESSGEEEA